MVTNYAKTQLIIINPTKQQTKKKSEDWIRHNHSPGRDKDMVKSMNTKVVLIQTYLAGKG